nr:putative ribonuclease H-like domain-containing protein [Tanacetum cinerariifolium]
MKFLRSLPYEWKTYVVVWINKTDLDTMSIDDLYNSFKIVKQEVKRTVTTSSSLGSQNMAFLSSPGSTNEVDTANIQVSTVSTPVSTVSTPVSIVSTHDNTANLSDATVSRKTVNVEDTSSKAMVVINGAGFDWSYIADDEALTNMTLMAFSHSEDDLQDALKDQGYFNNGCSKHMTRNISYLTNFKEHDRGYVAFGRGAKGGKITGKGTFRTGKLDFEDVYFIKELQYNLFSVSHMCDIKNNVLFTDTQCFVLSPNFKLADESQVLLKVSRKNNMYNFDMKNIVPQKDLTCLLAKATNYESVIWHMRLDHINSKNINKLVKDNLVRGLPSKHFKNDQACVACLKGKQHKVSFKSKIHNSISQPLFMFHMDLFGPTFRSSIMHKKYCLVITDDFSRFTWVFFLETKDETSKILKSFIAEIENLVEKRKK